MAGTAENIGGRFSVKFGTMKVLATECSTNINPVERTAQVSSDGIVMISETAKESTADLTLLVSSITDESAILNFYGTVSIYQPGTGKLEKLYFARPTGGLTHNHKDGTATISLIAASGEVVK